MLEGYIKRIFFDKKNDMSEDDEDEVRISHYVILEIIDNNNNDYNIKGNTSIKPEIGDLIEMTDYTKKYNQKYNRYDYETDTIIAIKLPTDKSQIKDRLTNLNILKYGKKRIELLVNKHHLDLWNIDKLQKLIESDINNKLFYEKVIEYINDKNNNFNKKINLLLDYFMHNYNISFTTKEISKIEKHLKNIPESVEDIDIENLLLKLCGYISDKKINDIIEKINFNEIKKNKIKIMIEIRKQEDNGNSCIKKDYLIKRININNIDIALEKLEEENYIVEYNDSIYSNEQYKYEENIAEKLYELYNNDINSNNIYNFGKYEEKINKLDKQQYNSILNMFNCKISIITGGPGYGKSSIIKTFLKMCDITKEHCTILGPTGKVVSKLRDDINEEANDCKIMTLHKFLRIYESYKKNEEKKEKMGDTYKDNEISEHIEEFYNETQDTDYIIIDEMSMISNKLFSDFLDNIALRDMTPNIVLIGDIDQLAAIECGDVLKNLIHSRCIPTTFLLTPYRYQKFENLKNAIDDINHCKRPKDGQYYKFIKTNNKKDFDNKFNTLLCEMIIKYKDHELGKQNALDNIMIITPMRNTIKEYQENIRSKHQEYKNNNLYEEMQNKIKDGTNKRDEYLINDYIIIKKNIYVHNQNKKEYLLTDDTDETIYINGLVVHKIKPNNKDNKPFDLFNGMVGYITRIVEENEIEYYNINLGGSDDKFVKIEKDFLNEKIINDYAYINTVHKYQGSENNLSIVVLPEKYSPFLSKQLLYTAVSRAKEECIVIGEEEVYEKMIKNSSLRYSNLKDIIIEEFKSNNNFNEINHEEVYNYAIKNNNLKKKSYGIPTMYNKILYRSRIEAKWAYIFDKLNLKHHYEYIDMNYYIPDFFITSECNTIKNLMIEVKNELYDEQKYDKYYQKAIDSGCCGTLLIINGCFEDIKTLDDKYYDHQKFKNCLSIGKLYFRKKKRTKISEMILYKNEYNEFMLCYLYKNNIYNKINKKCIIDEDNSLQFINKMTEQDKLYIENEWKKITNEVQYKSSMKPQVI
jgi:exodeoxyribonuclease V alpha subunit